MGNKMPGTGLEGDLQVPGLNIEDAGKPSEVLCLMNMVEESELADDDEYEGRV